MNVKTLLSEKEKKKECIIRPDVLLSQVVHFFINEDYFVVKEEDLFIGVLTIEDIIRNLCTVKEENLFLNLQSKYVFELLAQKPYLNLNDSLEKTLYLFTNYAFSALPVCNEKGAYVDTLHVNSIIKYTQRLIQEPQIIIKNTTTCPDLETSKCKFIQEMEHHILNPLQVIYSSLNLLKRRMISTNISDIEESECLKNAIYTSTKKIEQVFEKSLETFKNETLKTERNENPHEYPDPR